MTENTSENDTKESPKDEWLIRPCDIYEEEYRDCRTIKARFHQKFIYGKTLDCSQWKKDSDNCYRWGETKDIKSANALIASEKARRKERLEPHYGNTVWQRRKSPPENWNCPLPEHITREYEYSYLNIKSREMKGELPPTRDFANICIIM